MIKKNLRFVCFKHGFVKFYIGIGIGYETFQIFWMVSDLVSKKFGIEKSIGFGMGNIWYQKKSFGLGFVKIFGIVTHWFQGYHLVKD